MPVQPAPITEADNVKHEIHYTLDRPKDVVVAAYTKVAARSSIETEALWLQTSFSDAVRGLHVYGGKLVRPDAIAVAGVQRPAGI